MSPVFYLFDFEIARYTQQESFERPLRVYPSLPESLSMT